MDQPNTTRPSLPSISSLIEAVNDQVDGAKAKSPKAEKRRRISSGSQGQPTVSLDRPDRPALVESPGNHQPPTPELPPASSFDFSRGTESHASPTSTTPRTSFYPQTPSSTAPELYIQRNSHYPPIPDGSSSYPPLLDPSQWPPPPPQQVRPPVEGPPPDTAQLAPPIAMKADAAVEHNQYAGLAQQRPLPVNFPPPLPGQPLAPIDPQMAPTWQHHHYYPPANPPSYPQTQERYICPTCSKPFSRPSSLKIHTYSHTGEKPYKCKHEGCGKHFSVRSNMKRHEKGCHGGENVSASENSPKDV